MPMASDDPRSDVAYVLFQAEYDIILVADDLDPVADTTRAA